MNESENGKAVKRSSKRKAHVELAIWAKMKTILRKFGPRSWKRLVAIVRRALLAIEPTDATGWFAHCGYTIK